MCMSQLVSAAAVAVAGNPPLPGPAEAPATPGVARHDILLVEDEPEVRAALVRSLQRSGYTVWPVADGRAALDHLVGNEVRMIVTDIFMPHVDGLELMTRLRLARPTTPILAMSGVMGDTQLYLKIARHLGAERTLAKPFSLDDLLAAVAAILV